MPFIRVAPCFFHVVPCIMWRLQPRSIHGWGSCGLAGIHKHPDLFFLISFKQYLTLLMLRGRLCSYNISSKMPAWATLTFMMSKYLIGWTATSNRTWHNQSGSRDPSTASGEQMLSRSARPTISSCPLRDMATNSGTWLRNRKLIVSRISGECFSTSPASIVSPRPTFVPTGASSSTPYSTSGCCERVGCAGSCRPSTRDWREFTRQTANIDITSLSCRNRDAIKRRRRRPPIFAPLW